MLNNVSDGGDQLKRYPVFKTMQFLGSTSLVTFVLFILTNTATNHYFPSEIGTVLSINEVLSVYFIIVLSCLVTELLFKGVTNSSTYKWLHSPWMYYLAVTLLLAMFCYVAWVRASQPIQNGLWLDYTTLPLSAVLYCLFRQTFGLIRIKKTDVI